MSYKVSYEVDMSTKYQFMKAQYNGHMMTPLGWFPLELCNMENFKEDRDRIELKVANEFTSRMGAIFAIPVTLLDILGTWIATGVIGVIHVLGPDQTDNLRIVKNRTECNAAMIALIFIRIFCGARCPDVETKIDKFFAKRMHTNDRLPNDVLYDSD